MRLNTILPTCLLCLASAALPAQTFSCGMDAWWKDRLQHDPDLAKHHEILEQQRAETLARQLWLDSQQQLEAVVHPKTDWWDKRF